MHNPCLAFARWGLFVFQLSRACSRHLSMRILVQFAVQRPALYLSICVLLGLSGRLLLAHWDLGLFFDPRFPIFLR